MDTSPAMSPMLWTLLISWGVVTFMWIILLIYRGTLQTREDDHLILDAAEEQFAVEQRLIVSRVTRLGKPILYLGVGSGLLLVAATAVWLVEAFKSF